MTIATRSPNHTDMQLDNIMSLHIPTDILDYRHEEFDRIAKIDGDIVKLETRLEVLRSRKLGIKYGIIAQCINRLQFEKGHEIVQQVVLLNMQFINHPHIKSWMRDNKARLNRRK